MSKPNDPVRLVSNQSAAEIEAKDAHSVAVVATVLLMSNLMRVLRGAGKPHEIVEQADRLVSAYEKVFALSRRNPAEEIAFEIRSKFWSDNCPDTEWDEGIDIMISGALQMAASRLLVQKTQEKAGQKELLDGLRMVEDVRERNRREWQGKP